jgi:SAM-dependent methyltransferase
VEAYSRRTAGEAAAFLLASLRPGMRVLDVGCGPGSITSGLAREVAPGTVVGVDVEAYVPAGARRTGAGAPAFAVASAYRLPFDEAAFDVVYAHQVLQHLDEPVAALREMWRVLVPGGIVAVRDADYGTMVHGPRSRGLERWLALYCQIARRAGGEPDAGRHLLGWVGRAGFVDAVATTSTWTFADPGGRILEGEMGASALEDGLASRSELSELAGAWTDWSARPDGFFAFLHGEVVARRPAG